jgi:hypothetical protein
MRDEPPSLLADAPFLLSLLAATRMRFTVVRVAGPDDLHQ